MCRLLLVQAHCGYEPNDSRRTAACESDECGRVSAGACVAALSAGWLTLARETLGKEEGRLWYNPAMPTVLEGLWEEIVAQSDALKGKRVRVEVLEPAPTEETPANPLDALVGLIPAEEGSGEASLSVHHDEYLYPRR